MVGDFPSDHPEMQTTPQQIRSQLPRQHDRTCAGHLSILIYSPGTVKIWNNVYIPSAEQALKKHCHIHEPTLCNLGHWQRRKKKQTTQNIHVHHNACTYKLR